MDPRKTFLVFGKVIKRKKGMSEAMIKNWLRCKNPPPTRRKAMHIYGASVLSVKEFLLLS